MDIQIRKVTDQDAPVIAELLRTIGLFTHINSETPLDTLGHVSRNLGIMPGR